MNRFLDPFEQVSQDMAKESTLNNADVALVARSIQTAVDKYKLHPVSDQAQGYAFADFRKTRFGDNFKNIENFNRTYRVDL